MKILITGSSGMLGQDLCKILKDDHEIAGVDPAADVVPDISGWGGDLHKVSILDFEDMNHVFDKENPDLVIHAAAWTDVDGCERDQKGADDVNIKGTENIARLAEKHKIPVIYISTDFVFDGEKNSPYTEEDKCNPLNSYGRSKLGGEEALAETASDYAIVRTSWLYGSGGKNFVDTIIVKARAEKVLKVVNDQIGSPTYARDLAQALSDLVNLKDISGREIYHVSNAGNCSWFGLAEKIRDLASGMEGVTVKPIRSTELDRPAKRPLYSVLDTAKFAKRVGRDMRRWEEALDEYIRVKEKGK